MEIYQEKSNDEQLDSVEEILSAALALPPSARAMIADHLLQSLDEPNQKEIDEAWAKEAERRMQEIREGRVETIDSESVMEELRSRFNSKKS